MKRLIAIVVILFVVSTSLYSQTFLSTTSQEDTNHVPKSNPFAINLKASTGAGIFFSYLFGIAGEFQYKPEQTEDGNISLAWLLNINPILVNEDNNQNNHIITFLTAGPKFYLSHLTNQKLGTYILLGAGLMINFHEKKETETFIAFVSALGLEYTINETYNLNAEIKPNFNLVGKKWDEAPWITLLINLGFGIKL